MRTTITFTISLPPQMFEELEHVREEERRTRSELLREALRRYFAIRPARSPAGSLSVYNQKMGVPHVYFIGGVSGVGKSSVVEHLKRLLPTGRYDVRDFDEFGVPDGGGQAWHDRQTLEWLTIATQTAKQGKSTVICGFVHPERLRAMHTSEHPRANLFLLHGSGETIRKRLLGRYPTPESLVELKRMSRSTLDEFIENNVSFAPTLYQLFKNDHSLVVETDKKTPDEVARVLAALIVEAQ